MVHDDAEAEDVAAVVVSLLLDDLGAEVERRADDLRTQIVVLADHGALAEVAQLHISVLVQQDVLWLYVAVNDVVRVAVEQC